AAAARRVPADGQGQGAEGNARRPRQLGRNRLACAQTRACGRLVLRHTGQGGTMATVALLGTGLMGEPMARNLLGAGFDLRVWNRTREKAEPLGEEGARVCATPAEAAQGADVLLTMLADGPTTEEALGGGALEALPEGGVLLQM